MTVTSRKRVGELRPSQLMHTFGIGSIVDLPNLSVMVMGVDDWPTHDPKEINEDRLLRAVQRILGPQVVRLLAPPPAPDTMPFSDDSGLGVPVAPFPRWLFCPFCKLLAPIQSQLFTLKLDPFRPDRSRYIHVACRKQGKPMTATPIRFMVACNKGHLDDFPWVEFVHRGPTGCKYTLEFSERGLSGEAAEVYVKCATCGLGRSLAEAYGDLGKTNMPQCRGRRPQLRDFDSGGCDQQMMPILLGASNSWFPVSLPALTIPQASNKLGQLVEESWVVLDKAKDIDYVRTFREIGKLGACAQFPDEVIWAEIERRRSGPQSAPQDEDLKTPEWRAFSNPAGHKATRHLQLRRVDPPKEFARFFDKVVLVEKLREVQAMVGFTRIDSPNEFGELGNLPPSRRAPVSRSAPAWVPATEVRGEGIFIQFREDAVGAWVRHLGSLDTQFLAAHRQWRKMRGLDPDLGYPGVRYVLLHSFAHALIRQFSIECGYTTASLRERIYSKNPEQEDGPMAGVLIYTAAPDSEGTLGGLVALGQPVALGRHIDQALEDLRLCASDPLCAEHAPAPDGLSLHGASCHACLFAPETSCERGNKYLDRSVLVKTVERDAFAFFDQ